MVIYMVPNRVPQQDKHMNVSIDSRGHCVTPVPYQYDHETANYIMEAIGQENIQKFFHEFTSVQSHLIGSIESENYANNISGNY